MKFLIRLIVLSYFLVVIAASCIMALYVSQIIDYRLIHIIGSFLYVIPYDNDLRIIVAAASIAMLLVNFILYRQFKTNFFRERVIAFNNPSGQVSVSLLAIEDLVKRSLIKFEELKEVKVSITASKKGLNIKIKWVLFSDINIPEITQKAQDLVKKKIQDTIGVDENIDVTIHIGRIVPPIIKEKAKEEKQVEEEPINDNIPFRGYRA